MELSKIALAFDQWIDEVTDNPPREAWECFWFHETFDECAPAAHSLRVLTSVLQEDVGEKNGY